MTHEDYQDLAALDALGALDEQEILVLHRHLSECGECQQAEREYQECASMLALSLDPVQPPQRTRSGVLRSVMSDDEQAFNNVVPLRRERRSWWAAAAALFFLALFGWSEMRFRAMREKNEELSASARALIEENRRAKQSADSLAAQVRELSSPTNRTVELVGQAAAPSAKARVFLNDEKHAAFVFFQNLPPTTPNQEYELWVIHEGAPAPEAAGTFAVGATGDAKVLMKDLPVGKSIKAIAVTLEPKDKSGAAAGEKVLVGTL